MLLPSLVRTRPIPSTTEVPEETEDVFESALSTIFTDDLTVQHGNEGTEVIYRSVDHGDIVLRLAELDSSSDGEEARKKFAHYVWNSGVLMGDLVAGRPSRSAESHGQGDAAKRPVEIEDSEWGVRAFAEGRDWWIEEDEQPFWLAEGRRVIELGAGVGLGGIMSCLAGAREVAITDYPSDSIHQALKWNIEHNILEDRRVRVSSYPHLWGDLSTQAAQEGKHRYDRVIAADTLWLSGQHESLARSMLHFLSVDEEDARVLVIAGFHTGRERLRHFFGETLDTVREGQRHAHAGPHGAGESAVERDSASGYGDCLVVEDIFEMDADGRRRAWDWSERPEDPIGDRRKWVVVARLKRARVNGQ